MASLSEGIPRTRGSSSSRTWDSSSPSTSFESINSSVEGQGELCVLTFIVPRPNETEGILRGCWGPSRSLSPSGPSASVCTCPIRVRDGSGGFYYPGAFRRSSSPPGVPSSSSSGPMDPRTLLWRQNCSTTTNSSSSPSSSSSSSYGGNVDFPGFSLNPYLLGEGFGLNLTGEERDPLSLGGPLGGTFLRSLCPDCMASRHEEHLQSTKQDHRGFLRFLSRGRSGGSVLLKSLEKGVLFPLVHWSSTYNENLTDQAKFGPGIALNQGIFKELKRVIPPDVWVQRGTTDESIPPSTTTTTRKSTWLIIGYKSLVKTLDKSLEETWKDWTGSRHIYLNLRQEFEIRKISFLHRVHPQDNLDLFMYIVLIEIGNVNRKNLIWLLDFVQRTRVERMKGFLTVYSEVEQGICSIDDEYRRYLDEDVREKARLKGSLLPQGVRFESGTTAPRSIMRSSPVVSSNNSLSPSLICPDQLEINGNLNMIEKLLREIREQPIGEYF